MNEDRLAQLMVSVVDGVATPQERDELMAHLKTRPELAVELEEHMALKSMTDDWVSRLDVDLVEDAQVKSTRLEQRIGVALVLAGMAILVGFGLSELLLDPEAPLWLKAGMGLLHGGGILLLVSVIRHRLNTRKKDRYTEVIR